MKPELLSSLIAHDQLKPKHVEHIVNKVNAFPEHDAPDETRVFGRALRSISQNTKDPEMLMAFKHFKPHENLSFGSKIHSNLAANQHTPSEVLHNIGSTAPHFLGSVSNNKNLTSEHIDSLYKEGGDQTRYHSMYRHPNLSETTFNRMMDHDKDEGGDGETGYKLRMLSENPNLPKHRQERIFSKAHELVGKSYTGFDSLQNLAAHKDLDEDVARKIKQHYANDDDIMGTLRSNRSLRSEVTE